MALEILLNTGLGNHFLPDGTKPLLELMMTPHQYVFEIHLTMFIQEAIATFINRQRHYFRWWSYFIYTGLSAIENIARNKPGWTLEDGFKATHVNFILTNDDDPITRMTYMFTPKFRIGLLWRLSNWLCIFYG